VPNSDPHMQIARKIRSIETAKIELLQQAAEIYKSLQTGSERELAHSIGGIVAIAYFIGKQMGVPLESIDREALTSLPKTLSQHALDVADYESVQRYLASKR